MPKDTTTLEEILDPLNHEQLELVRSIRNRCDLLLCDAVRVQAPHTIYTLCEDLLIDCQELVDQVCVVDRED